MNLLENAIRLMWEADARRGPPMEAKNVTTAQLLPAWRSDRPLEKEWDSAKAVREGFKASETAFACTTRLAQSVASVPWYVEERQGDGEWERASGHPLEELLANPNPYMSGQDLFERLMQHLGLAGNGLWTIITVSSRRGGPTPVELWPVDPAGLKPIPSRANFISGYEYQRDGEKVVIPADKVVHFLLSDPANPYWGMSPLQAVARAVDTQVAAMRWNLFAFDNRAIPDGMLTFDQPMSREEWEQARTEVHNELSGPSNARRMLVLGGGAKFEMVSWKPSEMDFIASLKHYRESIASAYGVPLPMLGIYEDATLANLEGSRRLFWEDTILPLLEAIRSTLNRVLVPMFGTRAKLRVCYDTSSVPALRQDFGAKVDQYAKLVEAGVSPNAARKRLEMDLEDEPGGDVPFVRATLVPMPLVAEIAEQERRMGRTDTLEVA